MASLTQTVSHLTEELTKTQEKIVASLTALAELKINSMMEQNLQIEFRFHTSIIAILMNQLARM